jgi:hypothetical protein
MLEGFVKGAIFRITITGVEQVVAFCPDTLLDGFTDRFGAGFIHGKHVEISVRHHDRRRHGFEAFGVQFEFFDGTFVCECDSFLVFPLGFHFSPFLVYFSWLERTVGGYPIESQTLSRYNSGCR